MNKAVMIDPESNRLENISIYMARITQEYLNKLPLEEREQKIRVFKYMFKQMT